MTSSNDSVHVSLIDDSTIVCIHNVEYNSRGRDIGGKVYLDVECLDWLIAALGEYLRTETPQRKAFTNDDLEVTYAGPDYQPLVAILSRRDPEARHGGKTGETMTPKLGATLLADLEALRRQMDADRERSEEKKDWNALFAERKAAQDAEKASALAQAKTAAEGTAKEPFDADRFREIYARLNTTDQYTAWETLLSEAEYDYYVSFSDKMSLQEFIEHQKWLDGWG
jgi:hypothetical protein